MLQFLGALVCLVVLITAVFGVCYFGFLYRFVGCTDLGWLAFGLVIVFAGYDLLLLR